MSVFVVDLIIDRYTFVTQNKNKAIKNFKN